jgi:hypothetical protein
VWPQDRRNGDEMLFEFVRVSDGARVCCDLRFHGWGLGWEGRFSAGGELITSRGCFQMKTEAILWAMREREVMEAPDRRRG